jgi:uncharacterized protein (DUF924 family)
MADPVEVLDFWLGDIGPDRWFAGGDDIDALCRDRFIEVWEAAREGNLDHWVDGAVGTLAFLVVTDQLARNMHRGHADAFATDAMARDAARKALAEGWDMEAPEPERMFFYLPFEHSEDPVDQAFAVSLMQDRLPSDPEMVIHARAHQKIIEMFGRFPFRNQALGRKSTPEEEAFMAEGGYATVVKSLQA